MQVICEKKIAHVNNDLVWWRNYTVKAAIQE